MADRDRVAAKDEEIRDESDTSLPSGMEMEFMHTDTEIQAEGFTQVGQGNSIVTNQTTNNANSNNVVHNHNHVTVNVTQVNIHNGNAPISIGRHTSIESSQPPGGQTELMLDLGQFGSVRIPANGQLTGPQCTGCQPYHERNHPSLPDHVTHQSTQTILSSQLTTGSTHSGSSKTSDISSESDTTSLSRSKVRSKNEESDTKVAMETDEQNRKKGLNREKENGRDENKRQKPQEKNEKSKFSWKTGVLRDLSLLSQLNEPWYSVSVKNSSKDKLQAGDVVWFQPYFCIYLGNNGVVTCDPKTQQVDIKKDICFSICTVYSGRCKLFSNMKIAQRAMSCVGRRSPVKETWCGLDFVCWSVTGLTQDQALGRGFCVT